MAEVKIKLSQVEAGKLYMKSLALEEENRKLKILASAYDQNLGTIGLHLTMGKHPQALDAYHKACTDIDALTR